MHSWNHFAVSFVPKNINDSIRIQEMLPCFIQTYRTDGDTPLEIKRRLVLSLLCTLYQQSLLGPHMIQQYMQDHFP